MLLPYMEQAPDLPIDQLLLLRRLQLRPVLQWDGVVDPDGRVPLPVRRERRRFAPRGVGRHGLAEHQQLSRQPRNHEALAWGWNNPWGPGYGDCQPDPFNINGGQPGCQSQSTGMFTYWICYGIRDALDGSSNTVAFSESLVGDPNTATPAKRINGVTGVTGAQIADVIDVSAPLMTNATLNTALQACTIAYQSGTNMSSATGNRWGWGAASMTLFQTVVPPNSLLYKWNACRSELRRRAAVPTTRPTRTHKAITPAA